METKKHIINLPKNKVAENISVKTENGQIIVNYELKEKFNLKKGEIYYIETALGNNFLGIYKNITQTRFYTYVSLFNLQRLYLNYKILDADCNIKDIIFIRKASEKEKETLLNNLAKEGLQWNAEKMCIEDIFNPKDGDFLVSERGSIFIYKPSSYYYDTYYGGYCVMFVDNDLNLDISESLTHIKGCRYATESEKQKFLEKLKEAGYTWNAEKKCLEEYVWKPKKGEGYFFLGVDLKVYSNTYYGTYIDYSLISIGNCFQTEEQAEKKAEELKEVLKKK